MILDSAKAKRKLVTQHKKRIREHMQQEGLTEYKVGDFVFTLQPEQRCRFTKKAFVEWIENLEGEETDEILSMIDDFESDATESRTVFKCKRQKIVEPEE